MGGLIATAFEDPFYLRFKYKPNCEDHLLPTRSPPEARTQGNMELSSSPSSRGKVPHNTMEHRVSSGSTMGYHWTMSMTTLLTFMYVPR